MVKRTNMTINNIHNYTHDKKVQNIKKRST